MDLNIAGKGVYSVKLHCHGIKDKKRIQSASAKPSTINVQIFVVTIFRGLNFHG